MRIDRLLAITILLLNRGRVTASELAERFEVSTKTIYRDMEAIGAAGIPVTAHQGLAGGYELMSHYSISRQFLSYDEMKKLLQALGGLNVLMDDKELSGALEKVQSLLLRTERELVRKPPQSFHMDLNPWSQGTHIRGWMNPLKLAIEAKQAVRITYCKIGGEQLEREIEPARLILKGTVWYLQAYCRLRNEFRIFRLSRITRLETLDYSFTAREVPSPEAFQWKEGSAEGGTVHLALRFQPEAVYRVLDDFPPDKIVRLDNGCVQVKGQYRVDEWLLSKLLSFGSLVVVEEPEEVRGELLRRAEQIIAHYRTN